VLVVIGNPPYNAFAGVASEEEGDLVQPYKAGLADVWGVRKYNLDELYVRFFRIAERRIVEMSGRGVVAFISSSSYLDKPSFTVMRQRILSGFNRVWVDNLNGDSRETGKLTPDGAPDPSVFSTAANREGIKVGTAIATMVRRGSQEGAAEVLLRDLWGIQKREDLLLSLANPERSPYALVRPDADSRHSFRAGRARDGYADWPTLNSVAAVPPSNGLMEKRGGALYDIDRAAVSARMKAYLARDKSWEQYAGAHEYLTTPMSGFAPELVRRRAVGEEAYDESRLVRYVLRPFDVRWAYYIDVPGVWNRARSSYRADVWDGNLFLVTRKKRVARPEGGAVWAATTLGDNDAQRGHAYYFPFLLGNRVLRGGAEEAGHSELQPNLSSTAREYLSVLGLRSFGAAEQASLIWLHSLSICSSPSYQIEHDEGIAEDWPRIPLPSSREALERSAALGAELRQLLDPEVPVTDAPVSGYPGRFQGLGALTSVDGGALDPLAGDLAVTAGWGIRGKGGITMPSRGRLTDHGESVDVWLNERAHWANVPRPVWEYTLGGYQVIKKWLSYREKALLGRDLKEEEARYVTEMIRRIAAILSLGPALDASYEAVKSDVWSWSE
jgi:hypothetical protein